MRVLQVHGDGSLVGLDDDENTHCTILYNDETHTFEQASERTTNRDCDKTHNLTFILFYPISRGHSNTGYTDPNVDCEVLAEGRRRVRDEYRS